MEKEIQLDIIQKNWIEMQFCCNLNPEEMEARKQEVEEKFLGREVGASHAWGVELEDKNFAPVPCAEKEGFWHYIAFC